MGAIGKAVFGEACACARPDQGTQVSVLGRSVDVIANDANIVG